MTDEQLMLLEQLTYLNENVYSAAGIKQNEDAANVKELLNVFNESALQKLESAPTDVYLTEENSYIQAAEWAATIRAIKADDELMRLLIKSGGEYDNNVFATVYQDPEKGADSAIVTFRGTATPEEWHDNAKGLYMSDTPIQQETLAYINSLPFNDITVVGHSKGGNKAMYTAILSDKVTYALSMDGPGFSNEFIIKYWSQIQDKSGIIQAYSLEDDFVNILMNRLPGINTYFCKGYNDLEFNGLDNHSPNSFFYYMDIDGTYRLQMDNSLPHIDHSANISPATEYLHELTVFMMNVMPEDQKETTGEFIGALLAISLGGEVYKYKGKEYASGDVVNFLLDNPEETGIVLAYAIEYCDAYRISTDEFIGIFEGFLGLEGSTVRKGRNIRFIVSKLLNMGLNDENAYLFAAGLVTLFDGDEDKITNILVSMSITKNNMPDYDKDIVTKSIWQTNNIIRDFSDETRQSILAIVENVNDEPWYDITRWDMFYQVENFFNINEFSENAEKTNDFYRKMIDMQNIGKEQVNNIFDRVYEKDQENADKITKIIDECEELNQKLEDVIALFN